MKILNDFFLVLSSVFFFANSLGAKEITFESEGQKIKLEILTQGNGVVWGFDFISPEEIVYTERNGRIAVYNVKSKQTLFIPGTPAVSARGQGGMLDISVAPSKTQKKTIFFTYSLPEEGKATTALGSFEYESGKALNFKKVFVAKALNGNDIHYGSRIVWESPDILFLSVGDRNDRDLAQKLDNHHGKILRLTREGKAAPGNPFEKTAGALAEIWSYGHRNPQGLALNPQKQLIEGEFGPRGGDEINLIKKGANYGWPIVTYGREYWGPKIGEGTTKPGIEAPLAQWTPVISPSGMDFYTGKLFPKWNGNLFIGALSGSHIHRIVLNEKNQLIKEEALLSKEGWRFRNVRSGPDGALYFSTDQGMIAKLLPIK